MFLKSLIISSKNQIIRKINFVNGLNLIVDETLKIKNQATGNNVGKTTVLKLIDFCLGAKPQIIYTDPENKRESYDLVKKYLIENEILIALTLTSDWNHPQAQDFVIERNFLSRKKIIRKINEKVLTEEEFETELAQLIFPEHYANKPTFRQLISHNIRYKDNHLNSTLKTLDKYTSDAEYETLYLFLLDCEFHEGNEKQEVITKLKQETTFKNRLEKKQSKTAYETTLSLINNEIEQMNKQKISLNINEDFEKDLDKLNTIKYQINKTSSEISRLQIRKELIVETQQELSSNKSEIDLKQLRLIYNQAIKNIEFIQKKFDDLVSFHNQMIDEKVKFIIKELPDLEEKIENKNRLLKGLLREEKELSENIAKGDSFDELEQLIIALNEKHRQKGEFENIIQQINEAEKNINDYDEKLNGIEEKLFSNDFEEIVKKQINKFNIHFASISDQLYGEKYVLNYDIITHRNTKQKLYKFSTFSPFAPNLSSGKKQGEISSFDIAYTLFADEENIPCLHFLLNDKKELMHNNQLIKIAELVSHHNIQFVASILKDKLPEELNKEEYFILKLSSNDKLFRIENN